MFEIISFTVLTIASILAAIGVIAFKNAVYSALSLILTLLFLAMFYMLLNAMFIAVVQVLIYAGAIMVLFLFVVTMLAADTQNDLLHDPIHWQRFAAGLLGVVLVGALSYLIFSGNVLTGAHAVGGSLVQAKNAPPPTGGDIQAFGMALFHGFMLPFEVTSLLIVIAILGALVFGRRA
jgi:NADH-quinone oxidoreductase subunit J